ncbi:MAG: hypothetical protein EOO60_10230 [Hymenobacter sp.]|nr:MAG: hypothetical protein EOO60_10230 [Hymenobacter sp.]
MNRNLFSIYLILAVFEASGQTCVHTDLSRALLFKTEVTRVKRTEQAKEHGGYSDSCIVHVTVINKTTHKSVAVITYSTIFLYSPAFRKCNAARSYTTGAGQNADIKDYDYGDFIIADFNFDGKEDFAAKNDSGGNRGPTYNFYLQNGAGSFRLDNFLTEYMEHFPDRIDKAAKTLLLESDNGKWYFKNSYRLNTKNGKWQETKQTGTHGLSCSRRDGL